jgi:hypothetical protein
LLRIRPFAPLFVLALAPLGGAAACGGSAFSESGATDGGAADAGLTPDADADADGGLVSDATPQDGDAALPFCATAGAHSFCEDFDTAGVPGKFIEVASSSLAVANGAKIIADTTTFVSGPNSALAETPALLRQNGDQATAVLEATIAAPSTASPATRLKWSAQLQVGPGCVANADGAIVGLLMAGSYGVAIAVLPAQTALVELGFGNDGGITNKRAQTFPAIPVEPHWVGLGVSLDLRLKTATVTVDGTAVLDTLMLTLSPPSSAPSASLFLGADVVDSQGISGGCRVHVDNVLFDVQ